MITEDVETAATDGHRLFFNPKFMGEHTADEQLGVLVHELLHAALRHVTRRHEAQPLLWNIAADIVVNGIIDETPGLTLPDSAVRDEKIAHLPVEEVYEVLRRRHPDVEKLEILYIGSDLIPQDDTPALRDHWTASLAQAAVVARMGGHDHGDLPTNLQRLLATVTDPPLDWRTLLWRYLTRTPCDFTSYDRRFISEELYLDAMDGESVSVALCIDTSGSIGKEELGRFLNELRAILRAYPKVEVQLYACDAKLHGPWAIDLDSESVPPLPGGGGTDFRPFFKHLKSNPPPPEAAIYLTDGHGEFPHEEPEFPTLWVINPGGLGSHDIPFGEVARML